MAALLAVASGVACGGGGGSSAGQVYYSARLSSSSLSFGNQPAGTTSAAQTVTVTNTGILDLSFFAVTVAGTNAGDFAKTADTCTGAAILPNTTCTVSVTFTPSGTGSRSATLNITDNASSSPQTVNLTGTGTGPAVSFSAPSMSFGNQALSVPSALRTETITNSGNANLIISTVTLGGTNASSFAKTADTCTGATVTPNSTCAVSVTFTPTVGGIASATLNFADNAFNSPQIVSISGAGDVPAATLSSLILAFSDQNLGTTSTPEPVTVTNTGIENLTISTVTVGGTNAGDFAKSADTCTGSTVTPNSACTVSVTFTPSATGNRTASLSFTDNTSNSPQVVSMTGMGIIPVAGISSPSLTFSHQNLGTTSTAQPETITNTGTGNLTISTVTIGGANAGAFAKSSDTCTGATVTPGSACTVRVTFTPSATVSYSASLNFTDNASNSPQAVSLSGTGTAAIAGLSSPSLAFGSQNVGTTSSPQSVILANNGTATLMVSSVAINGANAGDFATSDDTCTAATIMPGSNCVVSLVFKPSAAGARSASLSFADNAPDTPQTVTLGGTGAVPSIALTPNSGALAPGDTLQFAATAGGSPTSDVTWSVNGTVGGSGTVGTISAGGLYTAPIAGSAQLVTVQATLNSNTSLVANASVAIIPSGTVSSTNNPQVALYTTNVPEAGKVYVQFGPDTNYGQNTWTQSAPSGGGQVQIFVAGMLGFTSYHMRAVVQFADGTQFMDTDQVFTTGGLPAAQIPTMTATTAPGMTPNGGIEMLDLISGSTATTAQNALATDLSGNVIWYYALPNLAFFADPIKILPDGNVLINMDTQGTDGLNSLLEEVTLAGDVVWKMSAADLNTALANTGYNLTIYGTHHDVAVLPNGHLIVIASEIENFTDLPGYPGTTAVTGDVLIDLDTNHQPVWVWSEFDHLDVNRHPMSFPDWTHTNAVLYSPTDGDLVISIRHQYWVIKIDYNNGQGNGDIVWKLGWQGDFTLVGGTDPDDWFYAQHGPSFLGSNTAGAFQLTLFDNGDNRPNEAENGQPCGITPQSPCNSRVPVFSIDESALTATIDWEDKLNLFSYFGGNAEILPNGNSEFDECAATDATPSASVLEVTQDADPQVVWQLQITGQFAYRAMRLPSLYPSH